MGFFWGWLGGGNICGFTLKLGFEYALQFILLQFSWLIY